MREEESNATELAKGEEESTAAEAARGKDGGTRTAGQVTTTTVVTPAPKLPSEITERLLRRVMNGDKQ
ncbi:hypothetical protein L1887_16316 [Cichorium endivia]|nr:hypothetical protein L1887_16316 [Cichorium endivia]